MSRVLDELSKGLAGATTRRGVLKYLAGALFVGTAGCFFRRGGSCHYICRSCTGNAYYNCVNSCESCHTGQFCYSSCASFTCCPSTARTCCNGVCVNINSSPIACGGCAGSGATSETRGATGRGFDCTNGGATPKGICCGGVCCASTVTACTSAGTCT